MAKQQPSKRLIKYIDNRLKGKDKQTSALDSGYKRNTARTAKNSIEKTRNYEELLSDILPDDFILQAIRDDIEQKPRNRATELNLATKVKGMQSDKLDITSKGLKITFDNAFKPKEEAQKQASKPSKQAK